jgi:hypothetical protein
MDPRIYYDDHAVRVTSATVSIDGRAYPLRELVAVWHRAGRGGASGRRTLRTRVTSAILPLLPLVAAAVVAAVAFAIDAAMMTKVVLFCVAGLLALATAPLLDLALGRVERTYDRGTRVHEIWARWRGTEILLVRTGDRLRFGRIYRALQRALEQGVKPERTGAAHSGRSPR